MAAVMLFLLGKDRKTEHNTHFCMPLEPVFTRDCGSGVHFTDEPTGNLDSKTSRNVIELIQQMSETYKQTVVIVTHNEEIAKRAGRIIRMGDGEVLNPTPGS